MLIEYVPHRLS